MNLLFSFCIQLGEHAGRGLALLATLGLAAAVQAAPGQVPVAPPAFPVAKPAAERSISEWLARMQAASRQHSYVGTFVVSSQAGAMSSGRIWNACEGDRQIEKVESLSGTPRSTFRRNGELVTLMPEQRLARLERHKGAGLFPDLLHSDVTVAAELYGVRHVGVERVAGLDADVVLLAPRDALRHGLRLWSEKRTGLVVKLQRLGAEGEVLEQTAFSEVQLDAPVRLDKLVQAMVPPEGWRVEKIERVRTSAEAEGWALNGAVSGFKSMDCYRRRVGGVDGALQCVFSDGLAWVSLFIEPYDRQRHTQEGLMASGATQTLTRRIQDSWLTAVGEVPARTLRQLALGVERRK